MTKTILASDLLRFEIKPFLFGVLFSRIMPKRKQDTIPEYLFVYTAFKGSKAVFKQDFSFEKYAEELKEQYNVLSGYENWTIHKANAKGVELRFYIQNNLSINSAQFYNQVYSKLLKESKWLFFDGLNEEKKYFIRGYMETRGSIDLTMKLIAQDYFYNNNLELKRVQLLTDMMGLPISYANYNPRNLQPQFVSGENKRNSQFRINLFFYAKEIGFINKYKAQVFGNAYHSQIVDKLMKDGITYFDVPLPKENFSDVTFLKMLHFFSNNIYKKELTQARIEKLREELGFNSQQGDKKVMRNISIKSIFEDISPDECAICGTTKTFTKPNGRQSFHIHHIISAHNGQQYDNIANFVKLCDTCHGSLKKGRATKEQQIQNIISILHKIPQVYEYVSAAIGEDDIIKLAEEIQKLLG